MSTDDERMARIAFIRRWLADGNQDEHYAALLAEVDRMQKKLSDQEQRESVAHLDLQILKEQFDTLDQWWRDREESEQANWRAVVDRLQTELDRRCPYWNDDPHEVPA